MRAKPVYGRHGWRPSTSNGRRMEAGAIYQRALLRITRTISSSGEPLTM
jgi:hypothetical protein